MCPAMRLQAQPRGRGSLERALRFQVPRFMVEDDRISATFTKVIYECYRLDWMALNSRR